MSIGTVPPLTQWKRWQPTPPVMAAWGVLLAGFLWTYWETIVRTVHVWWYDARLRSRLLRSDFRRLSALVPPGDGRSMARSRHMVGDTVLRDLCARSLVQPVPELRARHRFSVAIPGRCDPGPGRLAGPAVGVAFDPFFDFHGAASGFHRCGVGREVATRGHPDERLRPANRWHPSHRAGRGLKRHSTYQAREPVGSCQGLQRVADDDPVLRHLRRNQFRHAGTHLEENPLDHQRRADRDCFQCRCESRSQACCTSGGPRTWGISFTTTWAG